MMSFARTRIAAALLAMVGVAILLSVAPSHGASLAQQATTSTTAACYPPSAPGCAPTGSPNRFRPGPSPRPGQPVEIVAEGFRPGTTGSFILRGPDGREIRGGTFSVDANGIVRFSIDTAGLPCGTYTVRLDGTDDTGAPTTLTTTFTVACTIASGAPVQGEGDGGGRGLLPRTGAGLILPAAALGSTTLALGLLLARSSRRRRLRATT